MTDRRKQALIEMAKRGTPEEQKIAESIIDRNGIDTESQEIVEAEFRHKNKYEERLLHQIASMVMDSMKVCAYSSKLKPKSVWYKMTKAQHTETDLYYSVYKREVKEEMDITFAAFVQRNSIFPLCDINNPSKPKESDSERNKKILNRAWTIDKTHIRKQIGSLK